MEQKSDYKLPKELVYIDKCRNGLQTFNGRLFVETLEDGDFMPRDLETKELCAVRINHFGISNLSARPGFPRVLARYNDFHIAEDELQSMVLTTESFDHRKRLTYEKLEDGWDLDRVILTIKSGGIVYVGIMEAGLDGHVGDMGEHWLAIIGYENRKMAIACPSWRGLQNLNTIGFFVLEWEDLLKVGWWSREEVKVDEVYNRVEAIGGWQRGPMGLVVPRKR